MISMCFPLELRTAANSINGVGVVFAMITCMGLSPTFVTKEATSQDFLYLTLTCSLFTIVGSISTVLMLFMTNGSCVPKRGWPDISCQQLSMNLIDRDFGQGLLGPKGKLTLLWKEIRNIGSQLVTAFSDVRGFLILMLTYGLAFGLGAIVVVSMPQIVCPFGYSKYLSTIGVASVYLMAGLFSAFITSILNDRYKRGEETLKVLVILGNLAPYSLIAFIYLGERNDLILILLMASFGLSFPLVPLCLELAVECLYPLSQGLINGCLLIASNIVQFLGAATLFALATDISDDVEILMENTCNISEGSDDKPKSFLVSLLTITGFFTLYTVFPLIWLRVPYKRRNLDLSKRTH